MFSHRFLDFEWENDVNSYTRCLVGEWSVIDCRVNNNDNVHATLWFNREKLTIDGERIKMISKNMFNITNLQLRDKGNYYCKACSQTKSLATINVKEGKTMKHLKFNVNKTNKLVNACHVFHLDETLSHNQLHSG